MKNEILGEMPDNIRRHLEHIIRCKERAIKSGFYGFAVALCKLHEAAINRYLDENKPYGR